MSTYKLFLGLLSLRAIQDIPYMLGVIYIPDSL